MQTITAYSKRQEETFVAELTRDLKPTKILRYLSMDGKMACYDPLEVESMDNVPTDAREDFEHQLKKLRNLN